MAIHLHADGTWHDHEYGHNHDHGHGRLVTRRRVLAGAAASPLALMAGTAGAQEFIADLAAQAGRFAASLDAPKRSRALYAFDAEARTDWHYVPRSRPGLPFRDMTSEQRAAATGLLRAVLSEEGYARVEGVRVLEAVLRGESQSSFRDPDNYALALFGDPRGFPWGFRFEGHHLSLSFTFPAPGRASATPAFWGANPAEVRGGPHRGMRLLAQQTDAAFALVRSLDDTQRREAVIADRAPGDVVAGPGRADALKQPSGLALARLSGAQRNQAMAVIEGMLAPLNAEFRALQTQRLLEAGIDALRFAWAGGMAAGEGHYFRLHGPVTLVEFDNTQDGANHIHSLWRDLAADFGADVLGQHYRSGHKNP
jgi:hypothetical protein